MVVDIQSQQIVNKFHRHKYWYNAYQIQYQQTINNMSQNRQQFTTINNFVPIQKIGEGSFSSVYKVKRVADSQVYALKKVKIASLKQKERHNALNQVRILASIESPYIISYKEAFFDDSLNILCIVMELASNNMKIQKEQGDLYQKIQYNRKRLSYISQRQIWKAITNITMGLEVLHSKSILHRDLKSANIFLSNGYYKLGDLNVAKVQTADNKLAYTQTGTPYYASPEIWNDQPYDYKSDIWSLGCLIYEMCSFRTPFRGKNMEQLYKNVVNGSYEDIPQFYSNDLRKLIGICLRKQPRDRPSIKQLLSERGIIASKCVYEKIEGGLRSSYKNEQQQDDILKTIKLPGNLKMLKNKLPKSKYTECDLSSEKKKHSFVGIDSSQRGFRKKTVNSMEINSLSIDNIEENPSTKRIQDSSTEKQLNSQKIKKSLKRLKLIKSTTEKDLTDHKLLINNNSKELLNIRQETKQLYQKISSLNYISNLKTEKSQSQKNYITPLRLSANPYQGDKEYEAKQIQKKAVYYMAEISRKMSDKKRQKYKMGLMRDLNVKNNRVIQLMNKKESQVVKEYQDNKVRDNKINSKQHVEYFNVESVKKVKLKELKAKICKVSSTPYLSNGEETTRLKRIPDSPDIKKQILEFKNKIIKNTHNTRLQ